MDDPTNAYPKTFWQGLLELFWIVVIAVILTMTQANADHVPELRGMTLMGPPIKCQDVPSKEVGWCEIHMGEHPWLAFYDEQMNIRFVRWKKENGEYEYLVKADDYHEGIAL